MEDDFKSDTSELIENSRQYLYASLAKKYLDNEFVSIFESMFTGVLSFRMHILVSEAQYVFLRNLVRNRIRRDWQILLFERVEDLWCSCESFENTPECHDRDKVVKSRLYETIERLAPQGWLLRDGRLLKCAYGGHTGPGDSISSRSAMLEGAMKLRLGAPDPIIRPTSGQRDFIEKWANEFSDDPKYVLSQWI